MPKCKNKDKQDDEFLLEPGTGNVFKDLGFGDKEAVNLSIRAQLISTLRDMIADSGLSQREMAKLLKVQQPRIAEIMKMKIQYFSIDTLLNYLDKLGGQVSFVVKRKKRNAA